MSQVIDISNVNMTVVDDEKMVEGAAPQSISEQSPQTRGAPTFLDRLRKPVKFHLAFLSLLLMVFIVSIDATALGIAIPVRVQDDTKKPEFCEAGRLTLHLDNKQ